MEKHELDFVVALVDRGFGQAKEVAIQELQRLRCKDMRQICFTNSFDCERMTWGKAVELKAGELKPIKAVKSRTKKSK